MTKRIIAAENGGESAKDGIVIGLAHYETKNRDIAFNLESIERALSEASGRADMLVFSEAFLQGFDCMTWDFEKDKLTAVARDSETMDAVRRLSKEYGTDIVLGYIELDGETIYSSCAVIEDGELTHNYRRISRGWKEYDRTDRHYAEGDEACGFTYRGREMMLALCGDMWDTPESFKTDGILIWPVFLSFTAEDWPEMEKEYAAQALKASKKTLMVNPVCLDPNCPSLGGAALFENGAIVQKAPYSREGVLYIDIG